MSDCEPGRRRYRRRLLAVLLVVSAAGAPAIAFAEPVTGGEPPALGARVDELLELGRRLNPGVAARALEAEAALARSDAAGRFPDPMFTTEFEDIRATGGTYAPESLGRVKYTVAQTVPLWGKRGLERSVASAEAGAAAAQRHAAEVELDARIKVVFASYYGAEATIGVTEELLRTVAAIAEAAQSRYAQGRGNQQDAISAEAEKGRLQHDLARQEAGRRGAAGRLNALLNRPMGAPARAAGDAAFGAGRGDDAARRTAGAGPREQSADRRGRSGNHGGGAQRRADPPRLVSRRHLGAFGLRRRWRR